jgi:hypothetical protein
MIWWVTLYAQWQGLSKPTSVLHIATEDYFCEVKIYLRKYFLEVVCGILILILFHQKSKNGNQVKDILHKQAKL